MAKTPFIILGAIGVGALVFAAGSGRAQASVLPPRRRHSKGDPRITLKYARKWGPIFGAPTKYILTLAHIESGHVPDLTGPPVERKDGTITNAYGLVQQMADEVADKVRRLKTEYGHNPQVKEALKKWEGDPALLFDPDFNVMISAWQIGQLVKEFGEDFNLVAAGYHQGQGGIRRRLEKGLPAVDPKLQKKGSIYLDRALAIAPMYSGVV